jgi:two-component system response regulator YesN
MKCLLDSISRSYSLSEIEESFQLLITAIIDKISENRNPSKQMMEIIDDFIKANYSKQIGLSDLCEATGMSHTFLNRIIKDNTGDTFIQYLNKYRVQVACEMLANKEYRIQDVAERAGFASSKYFIKVFKSQKGVTPGEYRD